MESNLHEPRVGNKKRQTPEGRGKARKERETESDVTRDRSGLLGGIENEGLSHDAQSKP